MASLRNRGPILETFKNHLNINEQAAGNFLSIAEGDGHHIELFAKYFNQMTFHPTEFDQKRINYTNHYLSKLSNVKPCQFLDSSKPETWSLTEIPDLSNHFDYILNVNMIHISTWESTVGLFKGCSKVLKPDGVLVTYGPYAENGILEPASNRQFDESLRSKNSAWGIRDVSELQKLAGLNGMNLFEKVPMESNNYCLLFKKC